MNANINKHWHHLPIDEVIDLLDTNVHDGLDIFDIKHRQAHFGFNVLTPPKGKSPLVRFLLQFNNPLVIILLVASVITVVIKDPGDAAVIFAVVLINAIIGYVQESRAEQAIAALAETITTEATVIRNGKVVRLPASELVPGDIVQLQSGGRVPADLRLVVSRDLQVAEMALTGESLPIEKNVSQLVPHDAVLAERHNMVYASTLVTSGTATGIVVATGDNSEVGRISQLISSAVELQTPLTQKINQFSRVLLIAILALSAITFGIGVLRGQSVADMLMAAIALAVGTIPEGLPAALTVTLAIGVSRMARRHAIIRNLPAVETLGSTTVICSDKTGTLTKNQMTVQEIRTRSGIYTINGIGYQPVGEIYQEDANSINYKNDLAFIETLKAGLLCNDSQLIESEGVWSVQGDPTEGALLAAARKASLTNDLDAYPKRLDTIPFDSQHQYMATLHAGGTIYIKGAAEVLLNLCVSTLGPSGQVFDCETDFFPLARGEMASRGSRIRPYARREIPRGQ